MAQFFHATMDAFIDRKGVADALSKKERKVMARSGAYARKIMRNGMKKGKKQKPIELMVPDSRGQTMWITSVGNVRSDAGRYIPKKSADAFKRKYVPNWREIIQNRREQTSGSTPGGYPRWHTGGIRKSIFFNYDAKEGVVKIGPTLFSNSSKKTIPQGKTVPQLINEGGTATVIKRNSSFLTKYRPRPFVDLTLPEASRAFAEIYEEEGF